ncbi:glycoside hydrolase family 16 protein [Proteobacteria bacterium 005FR1]|nr:glycoside hydrolase family 16 protein [Proteobacteria bacterium 005FR1]
MAEATTKTLRTSVLALALALSSNAQAGNWELVWSDEFEGERIDSEKWSHEVNCAGGGNNELQCYTARESNSYVRDGALYIVARKETSSGPAHFDDSPDYRPEDESVTRHYTSARLRTKHRGDWRYGRIEVRAKMPEGQGVWPAIWMLPTENKYGSWPLSGEIDIFEAININATGGNIVHGTLHYGDLAPDNRHSGTSYVPGENIWEQFHTYAIEWEEGTIRWYVDSTHFATQISDGWFTQDLKKGAAPFDQAFHLLLNLAIGGDWPGPPNAATQFPQELVVDYVRVYQCDEDRATGKGCATVNPAIVPLSGSQSSQ